MSMGRFILAGLVAATGVTAGIWLYRSWGLCWEAPGSEACYALSDYNPAFAGTVGFWVAALILTAVGIFFGTTRLGATIGVAGLLVLNPITDPGFFWLMDTADMAVGKGFLSVLAMIGAAALIAVVRSAPKRIEPRRTSVMTAS